jgi:propanol-preferring alcohol dehydrogenase
LCTQQIRTGFSSQGCFAEFVTISASFAIRIPHSLNIYEAAPLLCSGLTSYKAVKESNSKPGDFIGITGGSGGVGHLAIQYAKAMGLIVCAFTHTGEKMRFCQQLGADFVFDLNSSDVLSDAITQTGGGCHAIINVSPSADSTRFCIDVLRPRGTMIQVGLPSGSFDIPIFPVVIKGLTIKGSVAGTREDMIEAFGFADRGLIKPIISVHNFDHVMDVFSRFQDGKFGSIKGRQVFKIGSPSLQSDYLSYPIVPQ